MNTPQFKNWFAPSVATDTGESGGNPLVVFHGTTADDIEKDGDFYFFASSKNEAARYAPREEDGAKVISAVLRLERPLIIETELQPAEAWDTAGALYVERARAGGHDSIIIVQSSTGDKNFMVFDAAQIVRADTLPDFAANTASTASFKDWFGPSVATETGQANGTPLILFHGTTKDFTQFAAGKGDLGMHFGTAAQANKRLENSGAAESARVMPVYLNIRNPLRTKDAGDWNTDAAVTNILTERMLEDDALAVAYENALEIANPADGFRGLLEAMGYDGIVYGNVGEETLDFGEEAGDDSWIAFRPEQIKSAIGNNGDFNANNQDIRFSMPDTPPTVAQLQAELAAIEGKFDPLRTQRLVGSPQWDAISKEAGAVRQKLFELTGDYYGRPKLKVQRPSDEALGAAYLSPDDVPAEVQAWIEKNANLLTSDATDAVRWGRIRDTLDDERYPEGDLTIYRAVRNGVEIRAGDWVTTDRAYAVEHLAKHLKGKGAVLEETVDGLDVLTSPTGNDEEAIFAPRHLSGPEAKKESAPLVDLKPATRDDWARTLPRAGAEVDVNNGDIRFSVAEAPEAVAPTSSHAFKTWYRASQVVDDAGMPLPLFHGTGGPIDFDDPDLMVWGSVNPDLANQYAELRETEGGDHFVMPMYFRAERPFDADKLPNAPSLQTFFQEARRQAEADGRAVDTEKLAAAIHELDRMRREEESGPVYDRQNFWNDAHMYFSPHGRDLLRSLLRGTLGFDSIKMTEGGSMTWGVFESTQVKSVFNNGDFDASNRDVRFSVPEDPQKVFQARVLAAQELADQVRSTGQRLTINADGTVTLFHSTSSANAAAIQGEGQFRGNTWFSSSRSATLGHARPKHGRETSTISITIDPAHIEFSTGTGEFYAPGGLTRNEDGRWTPTPEIQEDKAPAAASSGLQSWSSASKVRTEDGDLQVVYHGTTKSFTKFSEKLLGTKTGALDAKTGFFFAENPKAADMFTWEDGSPYGGNILPVYLNITNPFVIKDLVLDGASGSRVGRIMEIAKLNGHDGVIFERSDMLGHVGKSYAVFSPEQIKSAIGNRGTYSPNTSDLRYSVAQAVQRSPLSSSENFDGSLDLPGGVHADIVAVRDKFASIYSWSSSTTGAPDTRRALRELRSFGRKVVVHDPGAAGSQSFSYWRAMASEGLVDQVFDENDKDITEEIKVAPRPPAANSAFEEWFGASAVRDPGGAPLPVYHGTGADTGSSFLPGSFFTALPYVAGIYASASSRQTEGAGPNLTPVFLSLQKPYVFDAKDIGDNLSHHVLGRRGSIAEVITKLKSDGHDGMLLKNYDDLGGMQDQFVIFDPSQAKSAIGNSGAYSLETEDLRFSVPQTLLAEQRPDAALLPPAQPLDRLNKVMHLAGWAIEYIEMDLTADKPKLELRVNRDDGRFIIAKVDALGRANFETFHRERQLKMDKSTKGRRPLTPTVEDTFLGRKRYEGARSMLRGMVTYLADNAARPTEITDMRAAWAGVMSNPVRQVVALQDEKKNPAQTAAFKHWFDDSLATVDGKPDSAPIVAYHGTNQDFTAFERSRLGQNTKAASSIAFFFSESPAEAAEYAQLAGRTQIANAVWTEARSEELKAQIAAAEARQDWPTAERLYLEFENLELGAINADPSGQNVMPVFLKVRNPKILDMEGRFDGHQIAGAITNAQRDGHDGLKLLNAYDPVERREGGFTTTQWVIFSPDQVKSALGNIGTFDPESADIRFSMPTLERQVAERKTAPRSAAFKNWFSGSLATVDEQPGSEPLVVYHGTTGDFSAFNLNFSGADGVAYSAPAVFATDDKRLASAYASNKLDRIIADAYRDLQKFKNANPGVYDEGYEAPFRKMMAAFSEVKGSGRPVEGGGANVMPLYMALKDPLIVDAQGARFMEVMPEHIVAAVLAGKDGLIVHNVIDHASADTHYPAKVLMAFNANQVKSAIGNNGQYDPLYSDIRFSMRPDAGGAAGSQWWRSSLRDGVSALPMAQAPAQGWKDAIQGLVNKGKVKPSEVEWSGVTDLLEIQIGRVSKDELIDMLDTQGLQLQETISGPATRYEDQQLPGGQNYRELLLTLPVKPTLDIKLAEGRFRLWSGESRGFLRGEDGKLVPGYETLAEAQAAAAKIGGPLSGNFHSSHWPEHPNVLAHIRFNTRVDADGARTLFVEEIQSDWAQLGRKQGLKLRPAQIKALQPGSPEAILAIARGDLGRMSVEVAVGDGMGTMVQTLSPLGKSTSFPAAPFIGSTDAWVALCIKRLISYAASEGFDKVAFITGEQSVERYRLDKRLQRVNVMKMGGKYQVFGTDHRGDANNYGLLTLVEIERLLGKDLAEKIARQEYPNEVYQGNDLIVGGKGMREFYDQIVPQVAKEVLRKLGGGQMEATTFQPTIPKNWTTQRSQGEWFVYNQHGEAMAISYSEEHAIQKAMGEESSHSQPSFSITPAMREMVKRGLPLFSFAGARSRTADAGRLVAQERIARGESAEAARQVTGWYQGPDRKWRFEISDDKARLLPAIKSLRQGGYAAKDISSATYRYNEEDGTYDLTLNPPSPEKTTDFVCLYRALPEVLDALLPQEVYAQILQGAGTEDYINDFQDARRIKAEFKFGGMNALPLDQVLEHPELFKAYPALQNVMVQVHPKLGNDGSLGLMDDGTRVIGIGVGQQLDALLHETQHIIQDIESFALGTMASTVGIEAYRRAAGEVEARNTTTRRRMTADERRASAPASTQDVPPEQVQVSPKAPPNDIGRVRQAIAELLRVPGPELPTGRGKIVVVGSDYIPGGWMPLSASLSRLGEAGGNGDPQVETAIARTLRHKAQAFFDPVTRTTGLIADRIQPGTEAGVFLHEMTHKHGRKALTPGAWDTIITTLKGWENAPARTIESKIFHRARDRAVSQNPGVRPDVLDEELFAYAVEDCYKRGVRPSALAADTSAEKWLDLVVTSIHQMTERLIGAPAPEMTAQDIVDLAYALAQLETPEIAERINEALQVMNDNLGLDPDPEEPLAVDGEPGQGPVAHGHSFG